ncbi:hypothetical protein JYQ62_28850 [Nostoc sp. UHCC 0702]|nr:hypothetical protein JYQ62_28850 [Nostoc sp. UHCC 0702]
MEMIPELEYIIGKQPPVPELSGIAAQNRFNLLLQKFIQVFTTKEHPLVIFLDDSGEGRWAKGRSIDGKGEFEYVANPQPLDPEPNPPQPDPRLHGTPKTPQTPDFSRYLENPASIPLPYKERSFDFSPFPRRELGAPIKLGLSPNLMGIRVRGAGGLGLALAFPHDVKSQHNHKVMVLAHLPQFKLSVLAK